MNKRDRTRTNRTQRLGVMHNPRPQEPCMGRNLSQGERVHTGPCDAVDGGLLIRRASVARVAVRDRLRSATIRDVRPVKVLRRQQSDVGVARPACSRQRSGQRSTARQTPIVTVGFGCTKNTRL